MGSLSPRLAADLRDRLGLRRGVETGTYEGRSARVLGETFPEVVTIELSDEIAERARKNLVDAPHVRVVQGDSRERLRELVDPDTPTLWFFDGHWSAGYTAGQGAACPVLQEIAALSTAGPLDCVVIDDARLFAGPPPPPHDPAQWPTLVEVLDALRSVRSSAHLTVFDDQIVAVPLEGKQVADRHAQDWGVRFAEDQAPRRTLRERIGALLGRGA
jgi:hypothetical protein